VLAFDLCLPFSLLDEPCDFDGGLLELPGDGRDAATNRGRRATQGSRQTPVVSTACDSGNPTLGATPCLDAAVWGGQSGFSFDSGRVPRLPSIELRENGK